MYKSRKGIRRHPRFLGTSYHSNLPKYHVPFVGKVNILVKQEKIGGMPVVHEVDIAKEDMCDKLIPAASPPK
jgi:hypothetical protein